MSPHWMTKCAALLALCFNAGLPAHAQGTSPTRSEWYRTSLVNLHFDNHSRPLGKGQTEEELVALLKDVPVTMIQVSAADGLACYPSKVGPTVSDLGSYDTMAVWRNVCRRLGRKFCVYYGSNNAPEAIAREHPDWRQVDADGRPGRGLCLKSGATRNGYVDKFLIPQVVEIIKNYDPDGIWFDGDWSIQHTCWCPTCKADWAAEMGAKEPPTRATSPDWPQWLAFHQRRIDLYKQRTAEAIHAASPRCMYTSNWSWTIGHSDPRVAPAWADTLTGDVGAGASMGATGTLRFAALHLAAQEHTPYDIMSKVSPNKGVRSLPRLLQEGALTMASGGAWFLWIGTSNAEHVGQARVCAQFVRDREPALGITTSLSQTAILASETSWLRQRTEGVGDGYQKSLVNAIAMDLQNARFAVDVINEEILRKAGARYQNVIVPDQAALAPETLAALRQLAQAGGTVVVTGSALRPEAKRELPEVAALLGLTRTAEVKGKDDGLDLGGGLLPADTRWRVNLSGAQTLQSLAVSREPGLTLRRVGRGVVAYLASSAMLSEPGAASALMARLGYGPSVGCTLQEPLAFSLRGRKGQVILHATDLRARFKGKPVAFMHTHDTEANPPLENLTLRLPLAEAPRAVRAVPATTKVKHEWRDGVLSLTLDRLETHAAIILDTTARPGLLPPAEMMVPREPDPEPLLLNVDFESTPVGQFPGNGLWGIMGAGSGAAIGVTEETAASGKRSLKFTDSPNASKPFYPYVVVQPRLRRGPIRFACDLRAEAESQITLEMRHNDQPYRVGPSLKVQPGGKLMAGSKALMDLPVGQWCHLEMRLRLGAGAPSQYALTVTVPGQAPREFMLPFGNARFSQCDWLGVISDATDKATFYVDNFRLERLSE